MQANIPNQEESVSKDRKKILREEKMKKEKKEEKRERKKVEVRKKDEKKLLRKVAVKIGLKRIDTQKRITVKALLDGRATGLVISLEFVRKQMFKLKKIERSIYVQNVDSFFNKERPIEYTVEFEYLLSETQGMNKDRCNRKAEVESNFGNAIATIPQS